MKHTLIAALMAATVLSGPAMAAQDPHPGNHDARVRWVNYDPSNVVQVQTTDLRSTMIQFGPDEEVNVVAIGDQKAYAWQKVRNLLFIKPSVSPGRVSNMQVVTLTDGKQRVYQFLLQPEPADSSDPVFSVNFRYPGDVASARAKAAKERQEKWEATRAKRRLEDDPSDGNQNWRYVARGSAAIQPAWVVDNGEQTWFTFPGNEPVPAIYRITPDGKEQLATVTMHDGVNAMVNGTSQGWRLRIGNQVCDVWNVGFDPVGVNYETGTTSPDVVRTVRQK